MTVWASVWELLYTQETDLGNGCPWLHPLMNRHHSRESGLIAWKHPTDNPCKEERSGPLITWGTGERMWQANAEIRDWGWFLRSDFSEDVWHMIQKPTEGTTFYLSRQTSLKVQHPSEGLGRTVYSQHKHSNSGLGSEQKSKYLTAVPKPQHSPEWPGSLLKIQVPGPTYPHLYLHLLPST